MSDSTRRFFELLWGMTEKELVARYKHTVFGFLWIFINPLLQMAVIGFVFQFLVREPVEHYYVFLFGGLLLWNFFSLSLTKATPSIVYERGLIKKAKFPQSVIPISIIFSNLVHFVLSLGLLLLILLGTGTLPGVAWIAVIPAVVLVLAFTIGVSLCTSAVNVRFRDVSFFVQALLILWFYATPIIYPLTLIPSRWHFLWHLNPLTAPVQLLQLGLLGRADVDARAIASSVILSSVALLFGILVFRNERKLFDDWV